MIPSTKELVRIAKDLEKFLFERRESHGGYAEITDQDIIDLDNLVYAIIEAKCERDPDGDLPIQFKIINRRKTESLYYDPVPYAHKAGVDVTLEVAEDNLGQAMSDLERLWKLRDMGRREETEKKEKSEI